MSKLEKAIILLAKADTCRMAPTGVDPRAMFCVTLIYLIVMLSVPLYSLGMLILFTLFLIIAAPLNGTTYLTLVRKSLYVLPLVICLGIFNPIYDRTPVAHLGGVTITGGWISFASLTIRGLMAAQALLLLIESIGFCGMCHAMQRLGVPGVLTVQLQFVYRYLGVLLREALTMRRAREARGYGRSRLPLRDYGRMLGTLFLRTIDRAQRIHQAMLARGFDGRMPSLHTHCERWRLRDTTYLLSWTLLFLLLRYVNFSQYLL